MLTLLISTTTAEWAFSSMKLLKTRLRNRMEDELLADNMIVYIKKGNWWEFHHGNDYGWILFHEKSSLDTILMWNVFFFCVDIFVYVYSELDSFCMFINV